MADQNRNVQVVGKMESVPEKTVITKKGRFQVLEASQRNEIEGATTAPVPPSETVCTPRHSRSKSALPQSPTKQVAGATGQAGITRSNSFPVVPDSLKIAESPPSIVQKKGRFIVSSSSETNKTQQIKVVETAPQQQKPAAQQIPIQPTTQEHPIARVNNQAGLSATASSTSAQSTVKTTSIGSSSSSSVCSPSDRTTAAASILSNIPKPGRLSGAPSGMGKAFHYLEQMKQEVSEADKFIKSLQSDNKFLRGKNKELEARCNEVEKRYSDEKVSNENYELIIKKLQNKVATLIEEKNQIKNSYEKIVGMKESQISNEEPIKKGTSGIFSTSATIDGEQESLGSLVSLASLELLNATTTETKASGSIFRRELNSGTGAQSHFDPFVSNDSKEGTSTQVDIKLDPRQGHTNYNMGSEKTHHCRSDSLVSKSKANESSQPNNSIKEVGLRPTIENVVKEIKDTTTQESPKKGVNAPTPRSSNSVTPVHSFDPYEKK